MILPDPSVNRDKIGNRPVDVTDLLALLLHWGACPAPCAADFNGAVTVTDLLAPLAA